MYSLSLSSSFNPLNCINNISSSFIFEIIFSISLVFDLIVLKWDYKLNDSSNNIESIKECLNRASSFINKIKEDYKDKAILIVSHGGFIKCINYVLKGYNESTDFLSFNPKNTTLYEYDINE